MLGYTAGTMQEYFGRENVTAQYSPCGRLVLFDYNKTGTFARDWDRLTLTARGIVFEVATGKLIARGYDKFFNLEEPEVGGAANLPEGRFRSLEKADGSCIISFFYDGEWWYITRGSFISDQAVWAKAYASTNLNMVIADTAMTHIFEALYPENRIVIDYGDKEALVLTGMRNPLTGVELGYTEMCNAADRIGCDVVKMFTFDSFAAMMDARENLTVNEEGFVITYDCGFKYKLKGEEYCKVHRAVSNITPLHFYRETNLDTLKINESFLELMPEEFRGDVDKMTELIEGIHRVEYDRLIALADTIPHFDDTADGKKDRYKYVEAKMGKDTLNVMNVLNGKLKHVRTAVHRKVRPKRNVIAGVGLSPTLERIMAQLNE